MVPFFLMLRSAKVIAALCLTTAASAAPPNILFILADDHGFGALSATGAKGLQTPNIDRLRHEGMQFTDFYVHNRCSPTRLAFMTGSDANRAGYDQVIYRKSMIGIHEDEITTPELLRQAGYATGIVGKWHLGEYEEFNPVNHGFDSFFGFMKFEGESSAIYRNKEMIEKAGKKTDGAHSEKLRNAGMEFIRQNKDRPFFLYYASPLPHTPWIPSERFKGSSELGAYGDVMHDLDWQVGGLLDTLDELDLTDDTLVIYTADNGPQLGIGGEDHSSGIYRDGKWTNFEGGIRVPCFMRWPGTIAANSTNHEITKIYDLLPTFCELTKIPSPSDRLIDGRSLLPYILGKEVDPPIHESFLVNGSTFRYQHWKLFRKRITPGGQEKYWGPRTPTDEGSLYHLKDDPSETHDVSQRHPEIVQELSRRMDLAMDELAQNSRPIGKTADYSLEKVAEMRQKKERKSKEKQ